MATQSRKEAFEALVARHEAEVFRIGLRLLRDREDDSASPGQQERVYRPLLGERSKLSGVSLQNGWNEVHRRVLQWRRESAAAGRRWRSRPSSRFARPSA